jgi:hypothetical protein
MCHTPGSCQFLSTPLLQKILRVSARFHCLPATHKQLKKDTLNKADGWRKANHTIQVPILKQLPVPSTIPNFCYKLLTQLMISVCKSDNAKTVHWILHKLIFLPEEGSPEIAVHHKMYNSPDVIAEHLKL